MHGELCAWLAWKLLGHQPPQVIPKHRARDTQCHSFSSQAQHLKIDFISFICSTYVSRWRVQVAMQCTGHLWTFTLTHFALLGKGKAERSLQTQFQVQRKKSTSKCSRDPKDCHVQYVQLMLIIFVQIHFGGWHFPQQLPDGVQAIAGHSGHAWSPNMIF